MDAFGTCNRIDGVGLCVLGQMVVLHVVDVLHNGGVHIGLLLGTLCDLSV